MIIANIPKKGLRILYESKCLRDLFNMLEDIAFDYVNKYEVIERKFYPKSTSKKYGKCKYGYFIIKSNDKLTIMKKSLSVGWVSNSDKIEKIITFFILRPYKTFDKSKSLFNVSNKLNLSDENLAMYDSKLCVNYKVERFIGVHKELMGKIFPISFSEQESQDKKDG